MEPLLVKVSDLEIKQGIRSSPKHCPLALAITKANTSLMRVSVGCIIMFAIPNRRGGCDIYIGTTNKKDGEAIIKFVRGFDTGAKVEPFEFMLVPKWQSCEFVSVNTEGIVFRKTFGV